MLPVPPRKHSGDLNSFESTSGISTGSKYSNKIQDGLDDLIAGATGIRRSKIKLYKNPLINFELKMSMDLITTDG